jgi:hypothetical protein
MIHVSFTGKSESLGFGHLPHATSVKESLVDRFTTHWTLVHGTSICLSILDTPLNLVIEARVVYGIVQMKVK